MTISGIKATFLLTIILLLVAPEISRAEMLVSITGVGAIEGNNPAKTEKTALQDAFTKAALQISLKYVPRSSIPDLVDGLSEFMASRGMQDIIQYQITSRTQSNGVLLLNVDIRMNDEPLKAWINNHAFATPSSLRPKVLLMVTDTGGGKKVYEWWNDKGKGAYSAFESLFAQELMKRGENVVDAPQTAKIPRSEFLKPADIARSQGADLLITGTLTNLPVINRYTETSLKVSLVDVRSQVILSSWAITHKSDLGAPLMNALLINEIIRPVRTLINGRIVTYTPVSMKKTLCIEGITNYVTYQSIINALKSMDTVTRLSVTGVNTQSHSICHAMELKGSLSDVMENLRHRQIADADMLVEDDKAVIRLLHQ
jgi:hypothetical protein